MRRWLARRDHRLYGKPGSSRMAAHGRKRAMRLAVCLSYLPQISHAREAHIARLMASASIQGQGDEYRRPSALLINPASRIAGST
jgi:hypothetical protein